MVDCGEKTNRFVCPSDRQLALRAKLKTGWSVKTGSIGYHHRNPSSINSTTSCSTTTTTTTTTTSALDPHEQATILAVIQRAEQLELREQERVGKLVDRLENMRRNALGRNSSQCLLCGDHFGLLGAQSVHCVACRKLVCQKCAIETSIKKHPSQQQNHSREQWLCKICAETREMWKKSGAWFFKGLPKYILPGQEIKKNLVGYYSPPKSGKADDDSSSEEEKRGFLNATDRRFSHNENNNSPFHDTSPHYLIDNNHTNQYSRQTSSTDSQRSSTLHASSLDMQEKWDDENPSDFYRRDSLASRSLSDWTYSDERISPGAASVISSASGIKIQDEFKPLDSSHGTIEITLSYDSITDTLHCTVHRAKNLQSMDINGLADPFCKLNILPEGKLSTRLRTKTVHKTRNPEFNEALTFYEISENDLLKKFLHILVLDDDKYGHDYMGEAKLSLAALRVQKSISMTVALERLLPDDCCLGPDSNLPAWYEDPWSRGQILISLCYSTKRHALLVTVVRCANLLPMDNNGYSDPFAKLHLKPDPHHRKHKTSIKWKNLNPYYNEEFPFETRPNELSTQSLHITVWDKDYGKSNDYLGGLILGGAGSKGRRLKHWLDMIRYPDHRHEYWHSLTEDILTD